WRGGAGARRGRRVAAGGEGREGPPQRGALPCRDDRARVRRRDDGGARVRRWWLAAAAIAAPVIVLSPLTVAFAIVIVPAVFVLTRNLEREERRMVVGLIAVAIALRLAAIAALFLATDHTQVP